MSAMRFQGAGPATRSRGHGREGRVWPNSAWGRLVARGMRTRKHSLTTSCDVVAPSVTRIGHGTIAGRHAEPRPCSEVHGVLRTVPAVPTLQCSVCACGSQQDGVRGPAIWRCGGASVESWAASSWGPALCRKHLNAFEPRLPWISGLMSRELLRLATVRLRKHKAVGVGSNVRPRDRAGRLLLAPERHKHSGSNDREHGPLLELARPARPCPPGQEDLALALATATATSMDISGCRPLRQEVERSTTSAGKTRRSPSTPADRRPSRTWTARIAQ